LQILGVRPEVEGAVLAVVAPLEHPAVVVLQPQTRVQCYDFKTICGKNCPFYSNYYTLVHVKKMIFTGKRQFFSAKIGEVIVTLAQGYPTEWGARATGIIFISGKFMKFVIVA
jgi:hypothetical protein